MGEYEELCESMGLSAGSEEDYDRLADAMVSGSPIRTRGQEEPPLPLLFLTFKEAMEWAKQNGGKPITRTADGHHFTPVGKQNSNNSITITRTNASTDTQDQVRAFLQGSADPLTGWLPGTFTGIFSAPGAEREAELDAVNSQREQRHFFPRLAALAPTYATRARNGRYGATFLSSVMKNEFHLGQSKEQISELLSLLEGKVVRNRRWYETQAVHIGEAPETAKKQYDDLPPPNSMTRLTQEHRRLYGKTPEEYLFWRDCAEAVRKTLVSSFTDN
jgi:hypothetical protein